MPEKDKVTRDKIRIPIRTALMPVYYKDFCCIMGACQDNCCDCDWNIWFNKKDYLKLRRLEAPAEFKEKLDKTVRRLSAQEMKKASGNLYAKFIGNLVGITSPTQPDNVICFLNDLRCRGVQ